MSKYATLALHLKDLKTTSWKAKFSELERILGFPMPQSAYGHKAWWSNASDAGHSQSAAWQGAGWRSGAVDLNGRTVTFFKAGAPKALPQAAKPAKPAAKSAAKAKPAAKTAKKSTPAPSIPAVTPAASAGLTIAQAKAGLARHFSLPASSIEITIKG